MKRQILILLVMISLFFGATSVGAQQPAEQRYIVQTTKGLTSVLNLCLSAGCQVQGSLDGGIGRTYLVTSSKGNFLQNLLGGVLNLLERLLGIVSVEADQVLSIPLLPAATPASGLYDTRPINYYGTVVWNGYVNQPATQIIELQNAQNAFNVSGTGVIADIDTGVDTTHPALYRVLLQGYDFTRNQPGASEWLDIPSMQNGIDDSGSQATGPVVVQQRTVAVLDQRTVAVLDGGPYSDFGHGTMTAGLIHLAAPQSKILPLKAFSANGTGDLSNIVAALYYAVANGASVVNMSFDFTTSSSAFSQAVSYANQNGVILVAAAGNDGVNTAVYPAAMDGQVIGVASTSDSDVRSSWSNYGTPDVWIAAPGENVVTTYPGGTYASASGTSFSTPLVTGTAGLLLNARAHLTQSQAASAVAHAQLLTPDVNHGRLNVYMAIQARLSGAN
jgi:subtilisin family serine protease